MTTALITYILMAFVALSQIAAYILINSLARRIRNINLSEKIGESNEKYAKRCKKF